MRSSLVMLGMACLAAGSSACRQDQLVAGISDSTFVATIAELQRVQTDPRLGTDARARARDSVLRRHDVTVRELEAAARAAAGEPDRAAALWQAITTYGKRDTARTRGVHRPGGRPGGAAAPALKGGSARRTAPPAERKGAK